MLYLLNSHNPYSDWISLQLETTATPTGQWELYAILDFKEHWQPLINGRLQWGVKGGQLSLTLENCQISLNPQYDEHFWIATATDSHYLTWVFALKTNQSVYNGTFSFKLGTLTATAESFSLTATFNISLADVSITDAEGLWKHDISPNKHGVLERAIARFLQATQCVPNISHVQLGSQIETLERTITLTADPKMISKKASQLATLITRVYQQPTDDFIQLAKLAKLNSLEDFAGGNLLAAQLSGLSLGGANFYHTNLRGADLTDVDLSEANLNCTKLSGADLSGAYLGNANLRYADLHRASLALTNLIGADLQGANLQEANLSNTNLSGANLTDAKFKNNIGLTETMQAMILERGGQIE